jgi:hypothetical protein
VAETTVKRLLCCGFRRTAKAVGEQCWWICREINVFFSMFEHHMFYILYPFVTYLLTLPRSKPISVCVKGWGVGWCASACVRARTIYIYSRNTKFDVNLTLREGKEIESLNLKRKRASLMVTTCDALLQTSETDRELCSRARDVRILQILELF